MTGITQKPGSNLWSTVAASGVVFLAGLHPAAAAPTATWLTSWAATFDTTGSSGTAAESRCFGVGCTTDGQTISLGAVGAALPETPAYAAATAAASIALFGITSATGPQVIFNRQFQLAGSPTGWTVTLSGAYSASATVDNAAFAPTVSLNYFAGVKAQPVITSPNLLPPLRYSTNVTTASSDPNSVSVPMTNFTPTSSIIGNGTFWVSGQALVTESIAGSAINIFRSGTASGAVAGTAMLVATPAPEVIRQVSVPATATGGFGTPSLGSTQFVAAYAVDEPGSFDLAVLATGSATANGTSFGPNGFTFSSGTTPLEEAGQGPNDPFDALIGAFVPQSVVDTPGFVPEDDTKPGVTVGIDPSELFLVGSTNTADVTGPGTLFLGINGDDVLGNTGTFSVSVGGPPPIPEPATLALFGTGLVGLRGLRKQRNGARPTPPPAPAPAPPSDRSP